MARPSTAERLADLHTQALQEFDDIQAAVRDERQQCVEDRRFYSIAGAQWEGSLGAQFENKPRMEVNKVHLSLIRIFNEYRNNRIDVTFVPKDGGEYDKLADACNGLYRADIQDSCAEEAFDNAFEEGVGGGFAAWRLRACYEDEENPDEAKQRIRIEPIYDADSCVFFDLSAKRQDKSDAKRCFVLASMPVNDYIEEYDDDPATWPKSIGSGIFDWATLDTVYVAEYYRVETKRDVVVSFTGLTGDVVEHDLSDLDEDPSTWQELQATGYQESGRKKIKVRKVHKYILSGARILEDCGVIAGKRIPIVPFYGKRWYVDGIERCMGHVRLAKDAQRLKNMQLSKLAEISALSSVSKPILTPQQVTGHELLWSEDNLKNYPYLLLNPMTDANGNELPSGPMAYTKPPEVPPAMAALLQLSEQDMAEILGNPQGGEKMVSNISGKVVELIQTRLDGQSFIYVSNFAKAAKCSGEIWLGMAKELYPGSEDTRKMKTLGQQGEVSGIELGKSILDPETGAIVPEVDMENADMDVAVNVGPSSISKREAVVRSLTNVMGLVQDPETQQVLQSMIMMNMEGEGVGDVRDYFRMKLVKMGVMKPTEEESKMLEAIAQQQKPDPQALLMESMAQNEIAKSQKAQADTVKALADTEKIKAETEQALSTMTIEQQNHVLGIAQALDESISGNQAATSSLEKQRTTI